MISLVVQLPADDADVLNTAGSQLRRAPADGEYRVWLNSDQVDGQIAVNVAGLQVVEASEIPTTTANQLKVDGPPVFAWKANRGADVIINYNEVTGGTAMMLIQFHDMLDLSVEAGKF